MMMIAVRLLLLVIGGRVGYWLLSRNSPSPSESLNEWSKKMLQSIGCAPCGLLWPRFLGESGVSAVPNYLPKDD